MQLRSHQWEHQFSSLKLSISFCSALFQSRQGPKMCLLDKDPISRPVSETERSPPAAGFEVQQMFQSPISCK